MSQTQAKRITRSHTMHIAAPRADVFPLLCPVLEHDWLEGWNGKVIYSDSGYMEYGCVFEADLPGYGHIHWVLTHYDTENCVSRSVRINQGIVSALVDVALDEAEDGTTMFHWSETLTALSDDGAVLLDALTEEVFAFQMGLVEDALNHYVRTGSKLEIGLFTTE